MDSLLTADLVDLVTECCDAVVSTSLFRDVHGVPLAHHEHLTTHLTAKRRTIPRD
jgi:hypothetical protein